MEHATSERGSSRDMIGAQTRFGAGVLAFGGIVVEGQYLGSQVAHRVQCASGHDFTIIPAKLSRRKSFCVTCARPARVLDAEARFRARVVELGGIVVEPGWLGTLTPHRVRCADGHDATPRPNDVLAGHGLCRVCAGATWDAFYVVRSPDVVKFGITSGDPRPRLRAHRVAGLVDVVRVITGFPAAADLEKLVLGALAGAGEPPVRGREYFRADVLALVLDVVDSNHK